jgi:two-component system response regulator PrrA
VLRPTTTAVLRLGDLRIDADRRSAFVGDELLDLTRREFDLLLALATNPGVVLSRLRLLELVWGYDFDVDTNVVDVFVGYLRRKLAAAGLPPIISTVRGVGFVLEVR